VSPTHVDVITSPTAVLAGMHWLPVRSRIECTDHIQGAVFLSELIHHYVDYCDLAVLTLYRTVQQFLTFLSVLFVTPLLQCGIVFLEL